MTLAILAANLAGCEGCQREDKPYTPFGVASVAPAGSAQEPLPVGSGHQTDGAAPGTLTRKLALVARPPAARWRLEGRNLTAPKGRLIERGLLHDFDGNGESEALVWTLPATAGAAPGELYRIDASGQTVRLFTLPGYVPSGPGCALQPELAVTGKTTATLDVRAKCSVPLLARAPTRSLTVLAPTRAAPVVASLRIVDPGANAPLSVQVDSADRDADGRDDLALQLSVQFATRTQRAQFVWLDRASGAARDVTQPLASFTAAAGRARYAARRAKTAASAAQDIAALRLLIVTACAEGGVARLLSEEGTELSCGKLQPLLDDIATTEVTAALTAKDTLEAFAASDRSYWYVAAPSAKAASAIEKKLLAAVSVVQPKIQTAKIQVPSSATPGLLAVNFDSDGKLWVLSTEGQRQLGADGVPVALEADAAPSAGWSRDIARSDGAVLSNVAYSCDQPSVSLHFAKKGGGMETIATPLLAPRPGSCRPNASFVPPAAVALGLKADAPLLLLGATWVGPEQSFAEASLRPQPPGTPRSPNGKYLAATTHLGILVHSLTGTELWQADELGQHSGVGCTVNDSASQVACTTAAGRVLLLSK